MSVIDRGAKAEESPGKGIALAGRKAKAGPGAALAAPPRARLLPPEVGRRKRDGALRRRVWAGVVVVAILAAGGTAASFWYAGTAADSLAMAQSDGLVLQKKIAGFSEVKQTKADLQARTAARIVGGAADVDWAGYLRSIQATLPAGVTMTDVTMAFAKSDPASGSSTTPAVPATSTVPTVATLTFNASTSEVPSIPDWIDGLGSLPGFISAQPGAITYNDATASYSAAVTMDIGADALSYKYLPKPKEASK